MKMRAFVMLGLALTMGVISVILVQDWLARQTPAPAEQASAPAAQVVVAATNLTFGSRIRRDHLKLVDWPSGAVPAGAFSDVDELAGGTEDRVALRSIEPNEPVLASKVSGAGGRATLSTVLTIDKRAVTIRVNDVLGVAGFVLPGDRVDVLLTREPDSGSPITDILLQNLRVLGVDQEASDRKEQPLVARAVTLEVSPDEAQKLTLGAQVGTLSLALRNQANAEPAAARTIGLGDLRTNPAPKSQPVRAAASNGVSVRIIRGTESSRYEVHSESGRW